jgi:hypothetical protein
LEFSALRGTSIQQYSLATSASNRLCSAQQAFLGIRASFAPLDRKQHEIKALQFGRCIVRTIDGKKVWMSGNL